jgi:hypothetical protein
MKKINISPFVNKEGKIVQIPVPLRKKTAVLAYLAEKFEENKMYSEKEVNKIIDCWHTFGDYFILRRLLVDYNFLGRKPDGTAYWVTGPGGER